MSERNTPAGGFWDKTEAERRADACKPDVAWRRGFQSPSKPMPGPARIAYISGPMRGLPEFNFPAFLAAEVALLSAGWHTINPARLDQNCPVEVLDPNGINVSAAAIRAYFDRDVAAIRTLDPKTDALVVVGPEERLVTSKGTMAEIHIARWLELPVLSVDEALQTGQIQRESEEWLEAAGVGPEIRGAQDPARAAHEARAVEIDTGADWAKGHAHVQVDEDGVRLHNQPTADLPPIRVDDFARLERYEKGPAVPFYGLDQYMPSEKAKRAVEELDRKTTRMAERAQSMGWLGDEAVGTVENPIHHGEFPFATLAAQGTVFPTNAAARKALPVVRGVLDYFPAVIAELARLADIGGRQHGHGDEIFWEREKSADHVDCLGRHLMERGTVDKDGVRHSVKAAWRALAAAQLELEEAGYPKARGAR